MANDTYYSKVFHEIKNSVTLINSYMQLLEKKSPELAASDYWTSAQSEVARLRSITTELSQIKTGKLLQPDIMDINLFLTDCCKRFHCLTEKEGITCQLLTSKHPAMVSIDTKQFRHVIINLMKNACEAMNHHGEIIIKVLPSADCVSIHITDFGGGIPADIMENMFEPFTSTKEDGSGLGLNIAQRIVRSHHGTIHAETTDGVGSTFIITLPMLA